MPQAARVGDTHECPNPGPPPHKGGPIKPPNSEPNVFTNNLAQAKEGDPLTCTGSPLNRNFIRTGSGTVFINGKKAARLGDRTMHPPFPKGKINKGSDNVFIGGPTILGNPETALAACQAAASGRTSGNTQQSYSNCGVESARQVINQATTLNLNEDTLLQNAISNKWADGPTPPSNTGLGTAGGSNDEQRKKILGFYRVPSDLLPQTMENIQQAVAEGRGAITQHNTVALWNDITIRPDANHVVLVTGLEYDANGDIVNVYVNDTGKGECQKAYPANVFKNSLNPDLKMNVTSDPIW